MNWFQSTNAKEIGTLYFIFAVFSGMGGTAFSVLVRLELASQGVQFVLGDLQLFNVIITAHVLSMGLLLYFFLMVRKHYYNSLMKGVLFENLYNKTLNALFNTIKFSFRVILITVKYLISNIDYLILLGVSIYVLLDLIYLCQWLVNIYSGTEFTYGDSILQMSSQGQGSGLPGNTGNPNNFGGNPGPGPGGLPGGPNSTQHTNVQIIRNDNWGNTIRHIFIYGTGGLRLYSSVTRGGSTAQRIFILGTTFIGGTLSDIVTNIVTDPTFVNSHVTN
jgi:hypothetical protein